MKALIRFLVLLSVFAADVACGQSASRHSSSRGGTPVRQAAAESRDQDDAVETVDMGDKKSESGTASGEREGLGAAPEMPRETDREQNGLDSLSFSLGISGAAPSPSLSPEAVPDSDFLSPISTVSTASS